MKDLVRIVKVTPLSNTVSGVKFCALAEDSQKKRTGFGRTKEEAVEDAKNNLK